MRFKYGFVLPYFFLYRLLEKSLHALFLADMQSSPAVYVLGYPHASASDWFVSFRVTLICLMSIIHYREVARVSWFVVLWINPYRNLSISTDQPVHVVPSLDIVRGFRLPKFQIYVNQHRISTVWISIIANCVPMYMSNVCQSLQSTKRGDFNRDSFTFNEAWASKVVVKYIFRSTSSGSRFCLLQGMARVPLSSDVKPNQKPTEPCSDISTWNPI